MSFNVEQHSKNQEKSPHGNLYIFIRIVCEDSSRRKTTIPLLKMVIVDVRRANNICDRLSPAFLYSMPSYVSLSNFQLRKEINGECCC